MKMNNVYQLTFFTDLFKGLTLAITAVIAITLTTPNGTFGQTDADTSGYASVNGLEMYYEIHGKGEPMLLLHGGLGSFEKFNSILPMLTEERQVIGVDLHGHGRTGLGDRELNFVDMGNDIAAIIKKLGYDQVDVLGYSLGSQVALRMAIQHPEVVRRLVLVSTIYSADGYFSGIQKQQEQTLRASMAKTMKGAPLYKEYVKLAPNSEDFPELLDQVGNLLTKSFNWSEDVKTLDMPVMLIYGDSDMIRPEHIVDFYQLLGGGQRDAGWQRQHMPQNRLAILPNFTHYEMLAPEMVKTAMTFLKREGDLENKQVEK